MSVRINQSGEQVWLPILLGAKSRVIAITGSGGKTSLLYYLARLLKRNGFQVVVSLTTKMYYPLGESHQVLFANGASSLNSAVRGHVGITTIASGLDPADCRKLVGLPPEWFSDAVQNDSDIIFLIEADGSAGKSLKGYLQHEPVIPTVTSLVIPIIGIDVLGKPLSETYVHRSSIAATLSGTVIGASVTENTIITLLLSPLGYQKHCPASAKTVLFFNKTESTNDFIAAKAIADGIFSAQLPMLTGIVAGSVWQENFVLLP